MHYLTKKSTLFFLLFTLISSVSNLNAETLYSCELNGKMTTYHENDAKRMQLLGADCRIMNSFEEITCSMKGVRVNYSLAEAEELLSLYPQASCEMDNRLFLAFVSVGEKPKPLTLVNKTIIYFPINGKKLSDINYNKVKAFAKRHRNMGYTYTITGYASATGSSAKNHTLSLQRAGIVRNTLLTGGVNEDNILSVDALGEESLRYNTKYEERRNRAVVIKAFGR